MKIGLVIGHNKRSQGAIMRDENISEYAFWYTYVHYVVTPIVKESGHDVSVFRRDGTTSYREQIDALHRSTNDYDLIISFHFNGDVDRSVNGFEVLYSGNPQSEIYAKQMLNAMDMHLPFKNRGLRLVNRPDQRGYSFLKHGRAYALIVEPFFGSFNGITPERLYNMRLAFKKFFEEL